MKKIVLAILVISILRPIGAVGQIEVTSIESPIIDQAVIDNTTVEAQSPLEATINEPTSQATFGVNQAITFRGTATGGSAPYVYVWNFGDGSIEGGQNFDHSYASTGVKNITLTVTDFSQMVKTTSINLSINPVGGGGDPTPNLVISNISVTDITSTSAIVRWTTNRAASSRVIYDTVSHPSIAGQAAPNFGYVSSTGAINVDTKVTDHVVSVTGLSPATTYYFRVLSQ